MKIFRKSLLASVQFARVMSRDGSPVRSWARQSPAFPPPEARLCVTRMLFWIPNPQHEPAQNVQYRRPKIPRYARNR